MSSKQAQCPICNREYPMLSINQHIDTCLLNTNEVQTSDSKEVHSSPVRKKARMSPDDTSAANPDVGLTTSIGITDRTGPAAEKSDMDEAEVINDAAEENDSDSQTKKKTLQWGSLLRPTAKASKVESTPFTKKVKTASLRTVDSHPSPNRSLVAAAPSSMKSPSSTSSSSSSLPSTDHSIGGPSKKSAKPEFRPLAERVRPQSFTDFVGQDEAIGQQSLLRRLLQGDVVPSLIFWGPPGCGKTTLANIIAQRSKASGKARFVSMSATLANVASVKEAITAATNEQKMTRRQTILFIDEIHRFNKAQQDTFLPHIENGTITLIGATTENPSFKINNALLSRCKVIVLKKLGSDELILILRRAAAALGVEVVEEGEELPMKEEGSNCNDLTRKRRPVYIESAALSYLANLCDGDARSALNTLQMVVQSQESSDGSNDGSGQSQAANQAPKMPPNRKTVGIENGVKPDAIISTGHIKKALQRTHVMYDRQGDEHYNCISALHKSMRGSDANAALYWLARMLIGGEDPLYIARRLIAFASEDVGLADPQALTQAVSTHQACQFLGIPACEVVLAQCVIYLAKAPKSSMVESALMSVKQYIQEYQGPQPGVPLHLRPGSTKLMRDLGYGKGYIHSAAAGDQGFLPESVKTVNFFQNSDLIL